MKITLLTAAVLFPFAVYSATLPSPTSETTHWSFSSLTTAADFGPATMTAEGAAGATDSFVTETVGGSSATVLDFTTRVSSTDGYTVRTGIDGATDGGTEDGIEIWTMVLDIRFNNAGQSYLGVWNGNALNTNDADFFITPSTGGFWSPGTGNIADGNLTLNQFHRIVYRLDYLAGDLDIFVDGVIIADTVATSDYVYDGDPNPFWFLTDNSPGETGSGQLAAFGFTNTLLSDTEIATLGTPDAAGIFIPEPSVSFLITNVVYNGDATVTLTWNSKPGKTYVVHYSDGLNDDANGNEPRLWPDLDDSVPSGGETTSFTDINLPANRFYVIEEQ
jgi:hypothetical protein